ncbi:MAG: hypothetical protein WAW63_00335, partial [Candidatus Saccharimonadales bacterium]
ILYGQNESKPPGSMQTTGLLAHDCLLVWLVQNSLHFVSFKQLPRASNQAVMCKSVVMHPRFPKNHPLERRSEYSLQASLCFSHIPTP